MFPDLLFNARDLGPEVGMAPNVVPFYGQIETVDVSDGRIGEDTSQAVLSHLPLLAVDAEKDDHGNQNWLDTMVDSNPASPFIVFIIQDRRVSVVFFLEGRIHGNETFGMGQKGKI